MAKKTKILIIYHGLKSRIALSDMIFCFKEHPNTLYYYYAISRGKLPDSLLKVDFDLIIFHMDFLSQRRKHGFKETLFPIIAELRTYSAIKIAIAQDEWINTDNLNIFINEFNIDIVYSVAPESEFPIIYNKVDFNRVKFFKILTGYISDATLKKIKKMANQSRQRQIDIGYRAQAIIWLGKAGYLKGQIADMFNLHAPRYNLVTDISSKSEDMITGDAWYRFLLNCKYVIGVESGASLHDPDGSIWKKGENFAKKHPNAIFEEYENAIFPDLDGNLKLLALSPRHFEAAITGTCQVLTEGEYSGILAPGQHYIEIKKDFSNIDEVLQKIKDDTLRSKITERAYNDLITSGKYTYRNFVNYIITNSLQGKPLKGTNLYSFAIFVENRMIELWITIKARKLGQENIRQAKYYIRSFPYTFLIKLGMESFKKNRAAIRY